MGGGHHGHEPPFKVPDWRIYRVEDSPELMGVKKSLASMGLKDPWLRNEVWRYTSAKEHSFQTLTFNVFKKGFKWGLLAAVITTVIEKTFFSHGHGHGHEDEIAH